MNTLQIDHFLSEYQFSKQHRITVNAPAEKVYESILSLDMGKSLPIRALFMLRGMPRSALTLKELENTGFSILAEKPDSELVLGLAGRFWTLTGDMQRVDSENFISFSEPGFAKAAWNFSLAETDNGTTELSTDTRIFCTDSRSTRWFRLYWIIISPFSGWIRKEMLRLIKADAEG